MASKSRKDIKTARAEPQESAGTQRGFLRRWSERKVRARTQEELPASSDAPANELTAPTQVEDAAPPLTDADMPPVDTLDENSDYRGFLSPKVSEELRRLALRKLFHLPKFNIRDGLDDYDEDYRTVEALGNIVTAHERHQMELRRQEEEERLASEKSADKPAQPAGRAEAAERLEEGEQAVDETVSNESANSEDSEPNGEHSRPG